MHITEGLKQSLKFKRTTEDKMLDNLKKIKENLEKRLDDLYKDKLDGVITRDYYQHKATEYEKKITDLTPKIARYEKANINFYRLDTSILEFAKNAPILYKHATMTENQQLLNFLLADSMIKDKSPFRLQKTIRYYPSNGFLFRLAGTTGLEPATFCVTGRRSNQAELRPQINCVPGVRIELTTLGL